MRRHPTRPSRHPDRLAAAPARRATRAAVSALLGLAGAPAPALAGEVTIENASARPGAGGWTISVTLRHADTGWNHYADAWRIVGPGGAVLGTRTLAHPHVEEQPFTRSLIGVDIPDDTPSVTIEARDNIHGWSARTFELRLP